MWSWSPASETVVIVAPRVFDERGSRAFLAGRFRAKKCLRGVLDGGDRWLLV